MLYQFEYEFIHFKNFILILNSIKIIFKICKLGLKLLGIFNSLKVLRKEKKVKEK